MDNGFNLIFCNGDSKAISIQGNKNQTIITKGIVNTLFNQADFYYALKNNGISLTFDNTISKLIKIV